MSAVFPSSITSPAPTTTGTTTLSLHDALPIWPTTAYGSSSALNASLVTAHTVSLTGLTGSTLYHFRVRSRDAATNLATTADFTITTLHAPVVTPPTLALTAPAANASVSATTAV